MSNPAIFIQMAKLKGAKVIKDIWEEKDEFGVVRFATVQTVSEIFYFSVIDVMREIIKFEYKFFTSTEIQRTL
jgi:hypothetical protein